MFRTRHLRVLAAAMVLAAAVTASSGPAAARASKVDVCHVNGQGDYRILSVSENAYEAHLDHGDAGIGDPVPGMEGFTFDAACMPVAANIAPVTPGFVSTSQWCNGVLDLVALGGTYDPDNGPEPLTFEYSAISSGSAVWTGSLDGVVTLQSGSVLDGLTFSYRVYDGADYSGWTLISEDWVLCD